MTRQGVSKLISRSEFRTILKSVVRCLRGELNAPGLAPLNAEEIQFWFRNITMEDIEAVNKEIDSETLEEQEHLPRVQSMLQRIREKIRRGEASVDASPARTSLDEAPEDSPDKSIT
jgi:hypothetical protein